MKRILTGLLLFVLTFAFLYSEELSKPTYDNSIMFSMTYDMVKGTSTETEYIKSQFGNGLYASLLFTVFLGVDMDWQTDINNTGNGIGNFKNRVDEYLEKAREFNVGIHLIVTYGMSRNVTYYATAKEEDIRNAQWYNDNNISTESQMIDTTQESQDNQTFPININHIIEDRTKRPLAVSSAVNDYVFTTPSRYARKYKAHLEAKVTAAYDYLKQLQDANPDITIIISAPGESELNYNRLINNQYMQDYFCDYSPFVVLEFRDWIKHEGLYADGEKYADQGYINGGSRYQEASSLTNFNTDFGTSFTTWDLKYYNWSLSDAVDTDYTDSSNPDPNIIPISQYTHDGMMPTSGSNYISGGFDPPRVMQEPGIDAFYDLWHTFRENMIYNYVKDIAQIARESGFPKNQYYSHQIPADYLFGTRPNDPAIPYLNSRYYSSASPMWTADAYPDIGLGLTIYDINFGTWFARTTLYSISDADALSDNWAALEYNPEVLPASSSTSLSDVQTLYNQMMQLYNGNPHVISFFMWTSSPERTYQYKGNNRETAAKQFFDVIKDKGRQSISTVFTPKNVESFTGSYNSTTGLVNLSWSSKIWTDLTHTWTDWGDFQEFVIYRGYTEDFTCNSSSEIVRISTYSYTDGGFTQNTTVYYKIAAVNSNGEVGATRTVSAIVPEITLNPILNVSMDRLNFGYIIGEDVPPSQNFRISNDGNGALNWTATDNADWLSFDPSSAINGIVVNVSIEPSAISAGSYSTTITVTAPNASNSPQTIDVYLTVKDTSQNQPPFGSFDSPVNDSTVRSSIAVTGWVLDDVGIERVRIYRDPIQGETNSLKIIGDAIFVEGARPDIENSFPDYPFNHKAGWGYMLLTNFLPDKGNGTFTLYAIATDTSGNEVTLGTKTINCDNANAVKPFGAIDTPAQGGDASTGSFLNWGWVLTPMPNNIPTDGSTINVYVDGVNLGHPSYNRYRSDIANAFPGYANSDGAIGLFYLDTTAYTNGVHTIQWTAMDSGGNQDGIGSRYFTIQNSEAEYSAVLSEERKRNPIWSHGDLSKIPINSSKSIGVIKGYMKNAKPRFIYPNNNGIITIEIKELERLELHFFDRKLKGSYSSILNLYSLPIGSSIDNKKGVFYWQPGLGFLGDYTFDFVVYEGILKKMKRHRVKIKILPRFDKK